MSYGPRKETGEAGFVAPEPLPARPSSMAPSPEPAAADQPGPGVAQETMSEPAGPAAAPLSSASMRVPVPGEGPAGRPLAEAEAEPGPVTAGVSDPSDTPADPDAPAPAKPTRRRRAGRLLKRFFLPGPGASRRRRWAPWLVPVVIIIGLFAGGAHAWSWSNSPAFCGELCHTMPPQYISYKLSPHSRVSCVECHIGREFIGKQLPRKTEHTQFVFRMVFGLYEYPIMVKGMRPARAACETCHSPETFSDDSVRINRHFQPDEANTGYSIYLIMHTGGGTAREGLGRGIHWHTQSKVEYYATDALDQDIPYIRVTAADGSVQEYTDVESGFDKKSVDPGKLKTMDCITCHNRVSHSIAQPTDAVENAMGRGVIATDIPFVREQAVKALTAGYKSEAEAFTGIESALTGFYKTSYPDYYATYKNKVDSAIAEVKRIYSVSVFTDQELDWDTHPDNLGHIAFPGCFRCHDGKHLDTAKQAVRLECNICHSVPVVSGPEGLTTDIEVVHGPEPSSHRSPNWIALHNKAYDQGCADCHSTADAGGTSNTSFCSNSACHGIDFTFAGFNAPALREALQGQAGTKPSTPQVPSSSGRPTWDSYFGSLFASKCGQCHGINPQAGLVLTSYAATMKGGNDGPVIVPGDAEDSLLVQLQRSGHFAQFTPQQLQAVVDWIDAGAAEK